MNIFWTQIRSIRRKAHNSVLNGTARLRSIGDAKAGYRLAAERENRLTVFGPHFTAVKDGNKTIHTGKTMMMRWVLEHFGRINPSPVVLKENKEEILGRVAA